MVDKTFAAYDAVIGQCRDLFAKKMVDYGSAWRIMRLPSLTDQIFIKAQRVRNLQDKAIRKVEEGDAVEFIGIVNYAVMALIQLDLGVSEVADLSRGEALSLFDAKVRAARDLMADKDHDYGGAWRELRLTSMTDLILQKLLRIRQMENNSGKALASEGSDANYLDVVNYAVFSLIKRKEEEDA
ncbi:MAG: DUF1599 domain-containing protein [Flavobacteriales bacterium]